VTETLRQAAVDAARLQNGYAVAVDTRDWERFRTLFTPDVTAAYPNATYHGVDDWLSFFVPFHAECVWTLHSMTTHDVGADARGIWAMCYGFIQWSHQDTPGRISRSSVLYRDRLEAVDGEWRIARRNLDLLMSELDAPIPAGVTQVESVRNLAAQPW
jgi:SnoaL-like domain